MESMIQRLLEAAQGYWVYRKHSGMWLRISDDQYAMICRFAYLPSPHSYAREGIGVLVYSKPDRKAKAEWTLHILPVDDLELLRKAFSAYGTLLRWQGARVVTRVLECEPSADGNSITVRLEPPFKNMSRIKARMARAYDATEVVGQ